MQEDPRCYYARFTELYGRKFRFETRIYLEDLREELSGPIGLCVASVVCKNPGSASEIYPGTRWALIHKDPTLTTVRNIFRDAYGEKVPPGAYVRVWNLFYLCDEGSKKALKSINEIGSHNSPSCKTESGSHDIVWFAWGGPDAKNDSYKKRFREEMCIRRPFFFDKNKEEIIKGVPSGTDFAKHPIIPGRGKPPGKPVKEHLKAIFEGTDG